MKKLATSLLASLMLLSALSLSACGKDDTDEGTQQPTPSTVYESLEGTEWEGTFADVIQSNYGQFDAILHWTIDFRANGQGDLMLWIDCQATNNDIDTYDITYTYNGDNTGTLAINGGQPFVIDPYNRTMTATLTFNAEFESGVTSTLGGETVLHQMR